MLRFDCMHFHGLFLPLVIIFCNVPCSRLPSGLNILHWAPVFWSRLPALRGHVTNASFKQWVGILLMLKIDRPIKIILHPKFERKCIQGGYFRALWFLNKVVWFVLAAMLEGILLPSNMLAKTTFCFYLLKRLVVRFRCAVNVTTSSFQQFPWSLSAKFLFRKR